LEESTDLQQRHTRLLPHFLRFPDVCVCVALTCELWERIIFKTCALKAFHKELFLLHPVITATFTMLQGGLFHYWNCFPENSASLSDWGSSGKVSPSVPYPFLNI
jgi:hypothetical protein